MKNLRLDTQTKIDTSINFVYSELQSRNIHPRGTFDGHKRFYLDNSDLVSVRAPSAAWPNSQMVAGRTKKYVRAVYNKFQPKTLESLLNHV